MSFQRFLSFGGFFFVCVLIFKMSIIDDTKTYMWYRHITSSDYEFFTQFLTANFVHYSFMHMLLNIAGFFIIWHCFFGDYFNKTIPKYLAILLCSFTTTTYVYLFSDYDVYAGFSGVLHGLVAMACIGQVLVEKNYKWAIILVGLFIKIYIDNNYPNFTLSDLSQQLYGDSTKIDDYLVSNTKTAYRVCAESHIGGTIGGIIAGVIGFIFKRFEPSTIK